MRAVIYHNPNCSKSRQALETLRARGLDPEVVRYLEAGWTRDQLVALFADAGLTPREALRTSRTPAKELGLLAPGVDDETILAAMVTDPSLVERPFVVTPKGARLCRPPERILDLLE